MMIKDKPFGINLNKEKVSLLLRGILLLPEKERKSVVYNTLQRELETMSVIWDRRIKNEKLAAEQRKLLKSGKIEKRLQ